MARTPEQQAAMDELRAAKNAKMAQAQSAPQAAQGMRPSRAPRIPVPEATNLGDATTSRPRSAGFDMGPGNPRVGTPGDIGTQYRSANMGPKPQPGMRTPPPAPPGAAARAGGVAAQSLRMLGKLAPVAAGVDMVSNFNDYKIDDPEVDSSAAGTFRALREGNYSGAGRSLSKGMLETGMDLGSTAAKTLDYVVPGKEPVSRAYNAMLRNQFGDQLIDKSGSPVAAPSPPNTVPAPAQVQPAVNPEYGIGNEGRRQPMPAPEAIRQPMPTGNAPGTFRYGGNGTVATGPVTEAQGGGGLRGGGTVSSLDTIGVDGYMRQIANMRALTNPEVAAAAAANQATLAQAERTVSPFAADTARRTQKMETESRIRDLMRSGVSPRQALPFASQEAALAEQRRSADQSAGVQIAGINSNANVAMRNQDITEQGIAQGMRTAQMRDETDRRGQDLVFDASRATNQIAGMRAGREQANWQATFNAGRSDAAFAQQQQATKAFTDQVASWIPTVNENGKQVPDQRTAARYVVAAQSVVGRMGMKMTDLDDKDKSRLIAGLQLADIASGTATNGITPWGTKGIASNEPIMSLQKVDGGNYRTNRRGVNGELEIIPARYVEKEGSLFGMQYFGKPSNRFAELVQKEEKK